jgi:hypothetical protein
MYSEEDYIRSVESLPIRSVDELLSFKAECGMSLFKIV